MQGTKRATAIDTEMFLGGRGERGGTLCMQEKPKQAKQRNLFTASINCVHWFFFHYSAWGERGRDGPFYWGGGQVFSPSVYQSLST